MAWRRPDPPAGIGPEAQRIYVGLAARDGDFRAAHRRGLTETPAMRNRFVVLRARWLQWQREYPSYDTLPDFLSKG